MLSYNMIFVFFLSGNLVPNSSGTQKKFQNFDKTTFNVYQISTETVE